MTEQRMDSAFDWPDEIHENDFDDAVSYWPKEHLVGVERSEAIRRINALVDREVVTPWRAEVAIWFWASGPIDVPVVDRPDPLDPDWVGKAMIALGRAAMRAQLIERYELLD